MWRTEDDGDFTRGLAEGVGLVLPGADDERAVDGGPEPGAVRVPPQRALLPGDAEDVGELGERLYRALRDHVGAVGPPALQLEDAVPAHAEKRARRCRHAAGLPLGRKVWALPISNIIQNGPTIGMEYLLLTSGWILGTASR